MDDRTTLRKCKLDLLSEIAALQKKVDAIEAAPQFLANAPKPPRVPSPTTNIGRALAILRANAPDGLTLRQLIQKSAEGGGRPFVATSISSQLRSQQERGFIKKSGQTFYALMS